MNSSGLHKYNKEDDDVNPKMFNFDPYEALVNLDARVEYLEHQVATAHALLERQHREINRQQKQLTDLQTIAIHHSNIVKEQPNG